jgi:type IV pilus assembly protein PilM
MLKFLTLKPEAFGLDISDLSLKIIKLKKKRDFLSLTSFGEVEIPPGIISSGEIKNEDTLAKVIREALKKTRKGKLKTKYVAVSLPEEKTFLQIIQLPRMSAEDLKSAVIYEAENYVPLPIEEVYLDSQIISPVFNHLDHLDVLIVALPRKIIDPYISALKKAGLIPLILEIESMAIARALIKNEVSPFPVLLIDLGATRTSFIIYSGYSLRFTCSIPVSSLKFTEAICKTLNINPKEAEKLKTKYGVKKENEESKRIFEALIPPLTDLIEQIKKYISYYQTHTSHEHLPPDGKGIAKIFLSGGGANLKGLAEFLSSELKIPVEMGNPWINILPEPLKEVPELPFEESLKYTTALGLALRGIKNL